MENNITRPLGVGRAQVSSLDPRSPGVLASGHKEKDFSCGQIICTWYLTWICCYIATALRFGCRRKQATRGEKAKSVIQLLLMENFSSQEHSYHRLQVQSQLQRRAGYGEWKNTKYLIEPKEKMDHHQTQNDIESGCSTLEPPQSPSSPAIVLQPVLAAFSDQRKESCRP